MIEILGSDPVKKNGTARTLSAAVAERLRPAILSCRLQPGQRLRLDALKESFKVGYSPLREALMQLSSEGLVVLEGQRGFVVAPVSIIDLKDVMETRIAMEGLALADALKRGDDQWEASMLAAFHRLSKVEPMSADHTVNDAWFARHAEFHFSIIAAAQSGLLKKFWVMAYERAERYRRLAVAYGSVHRADLVEHENLMKAALARDLPLVSSLSERHIRKTLEIVLYDIGSRMPIFGEEES